MDLLPVELLDKIFNYLNLNDLLNCKSVSKYWYSIVSNLRIKSLIVKQEGWEEDKLNWYFTEKYIDHSYDLVHPNLFLHLFNDSILEKLKYLRICPEFFNRPVDLNKLNKFTQLYQLEISRVKSKHVLKLNLENLEILDLGFNNYVVDVSIESPKLKVACFYGYGNSRFHFKYPESITYLSTRSVNYFLKPFKNVETLRSDDITVLNRDILSKFAKLKEFYYDKALQNVLFLRRDPDLKTLLAIFMKQNPTLRIYLSGIEIKKERSIDDYGIFDREPEFIYASNYADLIDKLPFVEEVDYSRLYDAFKGNIPLSYFHKFSNIKEVVSTNLIIDQKNFSWFLKNLKNLHRLDLRNPGIDQSFYDALPSCCSLIDFKLIETDLLINYDFLCNFKKLSFVRTNQEMVFRSLELLLKYDKESIFLDLCSLETLDFLFLNSRYSLEKIYEDSDHQPAEYKFHYNLKCDNQPVDVCSSVHLAAIVDYFKRLSEST